MLACAALWSTSAIAQLADLPARPDVAGSRPQPEYDPIGVQIGPTKVRPSVQVTLGYDSNVFGEQTDGKGDAFAIISPSLVVSSDWSRNALTLSGSGDFTRYRHYDSQNTDEYNAQALGRLDVGNGAISPSVSISRATERRGTDGVPLTFGTPSLYRTIGQSIAAQQQFSHFTVRLSGDHKDVDYSTIVLANGQATSQGFRDTELWSGDARITYARSSALAFFAAANYGSNRSPHTSQANTRGGDGLSLSGGVELDAGMIRGELSGGYLHREFVNPAFANFNGSAFNIRIFWYPTPLLTVGLGSSRTLRNSGQVNVGAIVQRSDRIELTHELLRNLILHFQAVNLRDHYREIGVTTRSRHEQLRADFQFHRTVAFGAYERFECRESSRSATIGNYCAFVGGLSLTVRR